MLDLVPQSGVRVADVPVGRVDEIELDEEDWTAVVTVTVNGDVELPANAVAAIQQSSLLGEKYVELAAAGQRGARRAAWTDGALITLDRTNRNVEVEELLGALSLVLNGGGLAQLQTINRELGDALEGREAAIKDTLDQLDTFIGGLDAAEGGDQPRAGPRQRAGRRPSPSAPRTIETALDTIGPGLDVINEQRDLLVSMLEGLARLGDVGTRIIDAVGGEHHRGPASCSSRSSASWPRPARTWPARWSCCSPTRSRTARSRDAAVYPAELPPGADRRARRCSPT